MKKIYIFFLILITIPFYSQWVQQNSGTTQSLNDVYCISENIVIAVGNNGTILKTVDGGTNWIQKTSSTINNLIKVQFSGQNVGYAVGSNATLLKTINAGETWTTISIEENVNLYGLSVLNENSFFISGENGLLKKTIDGGLTFSNISTPNNQLISKIQFISNQIGFNQSINTDNFQENNLYKTIDGGISWTIINNDYFIETFHFLNENVGFIAKSHEYIYKTIDSGINLSYTNSSTIHTYRTDIFSLNEDIIWDLGNSYLLCWCSYYCVSKIDSSNPEITNCINGFNSEFFFPYNAIHFSNETTGFIVGENGTIYKNSTGTMEETTAGTNEFNKNSFIVSPNPSSDQITISFLENPTKPFSIEMTDFLGKKVYSNFFGIENVATINILPFSKGIYFLTVKTNEGKKETIKVIKK